MPIWYFCTRVAGHQGGTGRSPMTRTASRLLELWPFVAIGMSAILLHWKRKTGPQFPFGSFANQPSHNVYMCMYTRYRLLQMKLKKEKRKKLYHSCLFGPWLIMYFNTADVYTPTLLLTRKKIYFLYFLLCSFCCCCCCRRQHSELGEFFSYFMSIHFLLSCLCK